MKKIKAFLKAHWILVWLLAVAIAFTAVVSAEYIVNKNRIRRVIANVPDEGQQFSSNYLKVANSNILTKVSFGSEIGEYCIIPINIWNHSETNPQKAYDGSIDYTWTMQLVDKNGDIIENTNPDLAGFAVGYMIPDATTGEDTAYIAFNTLTYDQTDGYYVSGSDSFNEKDGDNYVVGEKKLYVRFPKSALTADPEIYVKITATPSGAKGLNEIGAILGVQQAGDAYRRGWSGTFGDDDTNTDYDAFNYVLSGSGEANITLSWCTDYLEMNPINITEYGWSSCIATATRDGKTWKTLTFRANSDALTETDANDNIIIPTDTNGALQGLYRYDIQFYMTGDPDNDYGSGNTFWDTVEHYVTFSAE